ncbi:MAG: DUF58 domain-containing protein [Alphaproteobacteria bacterium]
MALSPASSSDRRTTGSPYRRGAEDAAARLPALLVDAERVAATVAQGVHGRRRVGQGETFWQFRPFEFGDSPTQIDWRRSALGDTLFVRQTEWEAAQSVWVWRDASPSMRWRSNDNLPLKSHRAALLAIALMTLLVRGGERIALLGQTQIPATGRAALNRLSEMIAREEDRPSEDAADVPPAPPLPRHASAVLIGDLLAPLDETENAVRGLAARAIHGHLVQVLDPAEVDMPYRGRTRFNGLQREGDLLVGRSESLRDGYLGRLDAHQETLRDLCRRLGWTFSVHHTDHPPQSALLALYMALSGQVAA